MRYELLGGLGVGTLVQELVEDFCLLDALGQGVVQREVGSDPREGAVQVLGALLVVPDPGLGELALQLCGFRAAAIDVKGTPSRSPAWRRSP